MKNISTFFIFEHGKLASEWEKLYFAFHRFHSYRDSRDMGSRITDLESAVNRFTRLYEKDLPNICSKLKMNFHYMDYRSIDTLLDENEIEVRGLLKREEKERKKTEIKSVAQNFEV